MPNFEAVLQQELNQRLRFEELLSDISTKFINLPIDQIDASIEDAQRKICECLGFDLSTLWQWSDDSSRNLTLTHLYSPPGSFQRPNHIDAMKEFPWTYQKMMSGSTLVIITEQLPPEAAQDQARRRYYGIKSAVNIPLMAGGKPVIGVLAFACLHTERCWTDGEIKRIELVAQIFSNTLIRRHAEQTLRKNEERLSLAADSAEAGIWEFDCSSNLFWVTPRVLEIFGYHPQEKVSLERFTQSVHPDDLERVRQAMSHSFEKRVASSIEYRISIEPDVQKWVYSSGRPHFDSHGTPTRLLGISIDISKQKSLENELKNRLAEVESLKQQLEQENTFLRSEIGLDHDSQFYLGISSSTQVLKERIEQVADTDSTVLIQGETGTGKELVAQTIHRLSKRGKRLMVTVNCAALPAALVESELFGREKGAFTGALSRQVGRFELADGSTLLLDEIAEMPLETQAKLLRVLQEGQIERLGSPQSIKVDVRILAATNRNLAEEVENGRFRRDLFYRLNVFPINVPPLRERVEDIPQLTWKFVNEFGQRMGRKINRIASCDLEALMAYSWPGNIRELRNAIEHALIVSKGDALNLSQFAPSLPQKSTLLTLKELEYQHIQETLKITHGRIKGKGGAAELLGLNSSTLYSRMRKLNINPASI